MKHTARNSPGIAGLGGVNTRILRINREVDFADA
jgi:hypothetical protein